jgi:5-methylcytosine-specific restriction enzyme B
MPGGSDSVIPNVSREKLLEAMEEFDKELRDTEEWSSWEQKGTYKYAIVHDGQHYPVKQIISMAAGEPKTNFSGGYEANGYISKRGLRTLPLEDEKDDGLGIRDGLEEILANYPSARANEPFKGHELRSTFTGVTHAITAANAVSRRPTLMVKASMGQGNWATIPWISLLDTRETNTIQRGVYCVYLFREEMSGVYLALAQGVTEPKEQYGNAAQAREHLRAHAQDLRQHCENLPQHGFTLDDNIDLHTDGARCYREAQ